MTRKLHLALHAALLLSATWLFTDNIRLRAALEVARAVPPLPASPAAAPQPATPAHMGAAPATPAAGQASATAAAMPAEPGPSSTPFTDAIRAVQAQQEQSVKTNPFASKP